MPRLAALVVAPALVLLHTPSAAAELDPTDPVLYDCDAEYDSWETSWTWPWKAWCCEHFERGCPSTVTTTVTTVTTTSKTVTQTTSTKMTTTKTWTWTTEPWTWTSTTTEEPDWSACWDTCTVGTASGTCKDHILWASKHSTNEDDNVCKDAHDLVAAQCSKCKHCTAEMAGCGAESMAFKKKFQANSPVAGEYGAALRGRARGAAVAGGAFCLLAALSVALLRRRRAGPDAASYAPFASEGGNQESFNL